MHAVRSWRAHVPPAIDIEALPEDVDALKGLIVALHAHYSASLQSLHQQILDLRRLHFGAKSERLADQAELIEPVPKVRTLRSAAVSVVHGRPVRSLATNRNRPAVVNAGQCAE
ncbi:MAG: hypothetical protein IT513_18810, partial [Burkholderiales bacterium]|nr:hypothetical protein [Burkholderiales bacterium]